MRRFALKKAAWYVLFPLVILLSSSRIVFSQTPPNSPSSSDLINAGVSAMTTGNYATATTDFYQAMSLATTGSQDLDVAQFYLIKNYVTLGDTTNMVAQYQSLIQRNPNFPKLDELDLAIGRYYYVNKNDSAATVSYLQDIVQNHPTSLCLDEAQYYLINAYVTLGEDTNMVAQYQSLIQRNPNPPKQDELVYLFGIYYFNKNNYSDSSVWFKDLIDNYSGSSCRPGGLLCQMWVGFWTGNNNLIDSVYSILTSSYSGTPTVAAAVWEKGQFCLRQQQYANALSFFNQALSTSPQSLENVAEDYSGLGNAYIHQQQYTRAFVQYQSITALNINSAWNAYAEDFMGFIYSVQQDYPDAIAQYQHLIHTYTDQTNYQAQSLCRIGDCYSRQKLYDDALNAYQRVLSQYPTSSWVGPAQENIQALKQVLGQ